MASQYLLLAVLLIAPWTLGGVLFQTQLYLYAALLVCGVMWLLSHLCESDSTRTRYQLPLLILPIALGVIFGTVQLIPFASVASQPLGPAIGDSMPIDSAVAGFERDSISIYPLQTRVSIASLSFALLAFFLASQLFADHKSQVLLFGAIAVTGLALSFFGLTQKLSWNGHLFWRGPEVIDGKPFSAWVNRNNAAGYLNLTFAAALGMLVWSSFHKHTKNAFEYDLLSDGIGDGFRERIHAYLSRLGRLRGSQLVFGLCLIVIAAGVVASSSRGGILSFGVGLLAAMVWFVLKRETRMATVAALMVLIPALGLVSWLGISGSVSSRFSEIDLLNVEKNARYKNWTDTMQALPELWVAGSGLGTYRVFNRPYQRHQSEGVYAHAENQYVETLIEGGVVGLALLAVAILLGFTAITRLSSSRTIGREDGVALVGLVALATQFSHAFLDFGLTLPANMLLMAVLMGAVTGRAASKLGGGRGSWRIAFPRMQSKVTLALFAFLMIGNGTLGWMEISRAAIAEDALRQADRAVQSELSPEGCRREVERLLTALTYRPDDARLLSALSEAYIRTYQVDLQERLQNLTDAGRRRYKLPTGRRLTSQELSPHTSLAGLYYRFSELDQHNQQAQIEYLKSQPLISDTLIPARSALLAADAACKWLPRVELSLAYLSVLAEPLPQRVTRLERVVYLAPYEWQYLYPVGHLARASGEDELCLFAWKRTFVLNPQMRYEVLREMQQSYPDVSLANDFLPSDATILRTVIDHPIIHPSIRNAESGIIDECLRCIDEHPVTVDELYLDGIRNYRLGQLNDAITSLKAALGSDPGDLGVRTLLIEFLVERRDPGDVEQTKEYLQLVLPRDNEYGRLEKMIDEAWPESVANDTDATTDEPAPDESPSGESAPDDAASEDPIDVEV